MLELKKSLEPKALVESKLTPGATPTGDEPGDKSGTKWLVFGVGLALAAGFLISLSKKKN